MTMEKTEIQQGSVKQRFPAEALTQAKTIASHQPQHDRPQIQGITIDGPTSLDLDDAIWLETTVTGAIASIHISDVSEHIPPGTPLDQSAIATTRTRYFKQGSDPMLPRVLSENALSLQEGQPRATLTFELLLDPDGKVTGCNIFESQLQSAKRFSYSQADYAIAHPKLRWNETLKLMQDWTQKLNQQRQATGALGAMSVFGKNLYLDEEGRVTTNPNARFHSHRIIEEMMIAANTAAAQWLAERDQPALYRNHTAKAIAPGQDDMLQALITAGSAQEIRRRLMSWLNRAEYGPALIGHVALNLPAYGHFTSPIRRVADLINHRIIKASLHGEESPYSKQDLETLADHINNTILEEDQRTSTYYKDKAKQELQDKLESGDSYADLPEKEFSRLLKHADGELPPALVEEVRSRLDQGRLVVLDYYLLLIRGSNRELQERVLSHLEGKPQDAASVLSMAVDTEGWGELCYFELRQDQFLAWAEVEVAGEKLTTVEGGCDRKKQGARHRACWLWLCGFVRGELVGVDAREVPEQSVVEVAKVKPKVDPRELKLKAILEKPLVDGQNHVGTLIEICQLMDWEMPSFEFEERPEGFHCRCFCAGVEGDAIAQRKQLAKQRAALGTLGQMHYLRSNSPHLPFAGPQGLTAQDKWRESL